MIALMFAGKLLWLKGFRRISLCFRHVNRFNVLVKPFRNGR